MQGLHYKKRSAGPQCSSALYRKLSSMPLQDFAIEWAQGYSAIRELGIPVTNDNLLAFVTAKYFAKQACRNCTVWDEHREGWFNNRKCVRAPDSQHGIGCTNCQQDGVPCDALFIEPLGVLHKLALIVHRMNPPPALALAPAPAPVLNVTVPEPTFSLAPVRAEGETTYYAPKPMRTMTLARPKRPFLGYGPGG